MGVDDRNVGTDIKSVGFANCVPGNSIGDGNIRIGDLKLALCDLEIALAEGNFPSVEG